MEPPVASDVPTVSSRNGEHSKFAKRVETTPPDEEKIKWPEEEALAGEWCKKTIEQRAKDAGLENFYKISYRHGSSFEHLDSWSATSLLEIKADVVDMLTVPSGRFVDFALITLASCIGEITSAFGKFYGFDFAGVGAEMVTLVKTVFPGTRG